MLTIDDVEPIRQRMRHALAERVPMHLERLSWPAEHLAAHQHRQLRLLLATALEHSPFHAARLPGLDPDRFELEDLARLPVMTKGEMMAHFDDVVTDRRVDRRLIEGHLAASTTQPRLLLDRYVCLASGGSSGQRGVFVQTVEEMADFATSLMRPGIAARASAGGAPPGPTVIALVAAASPVHSSGFGAAVVRGGPVELVPFPATSPVEDLVAGLNRLQPGALMGYPSKLAQLAEEQRQGRLRIAPRAVTTTSDVLTGDVRRALAEAFEAPVVDQFASTEGLVGHSAPDGDVLTFATDMCLVEPVDEGNRPVPPGRTSAKVLVTNLHNLTQPLIRYELTDRFARAADDPAGRLRAQVEGRADEVFRYGSLQLHPHAVRSVLVAEPSVSEYQVRQAPQGIDVAVVPADGAAGTIDVAGLGAALERGLRRAGLRDPEVTVQVVDRVVAHPETGKVRRFVPLAPPPLPG